MSHNARHCRSNSTSLAVQCMHMTWSDKRLLTLPPATPKDEADLLAHVLTIAPGFDYAQNANTKDLQQST